LLLIGRSSGKKAFSPSSHTPAKLGEAIRAGDWEAFIVLDIEKLTTRLALEEK
jgi:hypothetical protein